MKTHQSVGIQNSLSAVGAGTLLLNDVRAVGCGLAAQPKAVLRSGHAEEVDGRGGAEGHDLEGTIVTGRGSGQAVGSDEERANRGDGRELHDGCSGVGEDFGIWSFKTVERVDDVVMRMRIKRFGWGDAVFIL
jgi:hypothetical protein